MNREILSKDLVKVRVEGYLWDAFHSARRKWIILYIEIPRQLWFTQQKHERSNYINCVALEEYNSKHPEEPYSDFRWEVGGIIQY